MENDRFPQKVKVQRSNPTRVLVWCQRGYVHPQGSQMAQTQKYPMPSASAASEWRPPCQPAATCPRPDPGEPVPPTLSRVGGGGGGSLNSREFSAERENGTNETPGEFLPPSPISSWGRGWPPESKANASRNLKQCTMSPFILGELDLTSGEILADSPKHCK